MLDPYRFSDESPSRAYVDVDAELDHLDVEDEIALGSEDLNFALGRPDEFDFDED